MGGTVPAARNWFNNNRYVAVLLELDTNDVVAGNQVTDNANPNTVGIVLFETQGAVVGGGESEARNVISGNSGGGIVTQQDLQTVIAGNWIGTALSGRGADPNGGSGVYLQFGTRDTVAHNVIAGTQPGNGNGGDGLDLQDISQSSVLNNAIGVDAKNQPAGNAGYGIGDFNQPGILPPTVTISGNTIANNVSGGVQVGSSNTDTVLAAIRHNSMARNGPGADGAFGIDLTGETQSACPSGATTGAPNNYIDCPTISSASSTGGAHGTAPANSLVDLYYAPSSTDPEGQTYIATVQADSSGNWSYTHHLTSGKSLTATATGPNGNPSWPQAQETSEFTLPTTVT
ncbi:MAG: right-handed parallel beta-helix repeat-containing protein [Chloroflexota bacterium]